MRRTLTLLALTLALTVLTLTATTTTVNAQSNNNSTNSSCPLGHFCYDASFTSADMVQCLPSQYCPGGQRGVVCPAGYYCPTVTEQIRCPSGHYCPPASITPRPCSPLASCPEGSERYFHWGTLVLLLILLPVMASGTFVYRKYNQRYQVKQHLVASSAGAGASPSPLNSVMVVKSKQQSVEMIDLNSPVEIASPVPAEACLVGERVPRMDIKFTNLAAAVEVNGAEKLIVSDVSGHFRSGRLVAVMGPSGAGKSSLINVLTGNVKLKSGTIETRIEGSLEDDLRRTRNLGMIGVVPQADIMISSLTPHDILTHSAFTRLPATWSKEQKEERVQQTIKRLGLERVQHTPVGDEDVRGVSGGEKKRVSIGIELVNSPSLLILDEPTTGLDATSSQTLLATLRDITMTGTTIVAVLHQPRGEIFRGLDDLLLLAPGGRTVFFGPAKDAQAYFEKIGYTCDLNTNPADFFIDVIAAKAGAPFAMDHQKKVASGEEEEVVRRKSITTTEEIQSYLADSWSSKAGEEYRAQSNQVDQPSSPGAAPVDEHKKFVSTIQLPSIPYLTYLYTYRSLLQLWRSLTTLQLELFMHILAGGIIGMAFVDQNWFVLPINPGYVKYCPEPMRRSCEQDAIRDILDLMTTYTVMALGLVSAIIGNRAYGQELLNMKREASAGLSATAYYWGKSISELPLIIIYSFVYCVAYFLVASPSSTFASFFTAILLFEYCMFGIGYVSSLLLSNENALLLSSIAALLAGLATNAKGIEKNFCWGRWVAEALFISEIRTDLYVEPLNTLVQVYMDQKNKFKVNNYATDIVILFVMGTVLRLWAYGLVARKFRSGK